MSSSLTELAQTIASAGVHYWKFALTLQHVVINEQNQCYVIIHQNYSEKQQMFLGGD